ncbi:MAG TPA: PEGA domain-containing protein [Candidatus Sulfotelmatobacter sp.]|nr:PEGA domain-containing protein [Candidatus Sulfotelmatobacter sp.]
MLRRLAVLAACVVFLGAVPTGSLYVTTLPSGADVWVDSTYVGRSPVVLDALASGHHAVGLAKSGWTTEQLDVSIVSGQTTLSSTRLRQTGGLRPAGGSIVLHGDTGDEVRLDGQVVHPGKGGSYPASAGTHELVVRSANAKMTRSVTVWPDTRTEVVLVPDVPPPRPTVVAPADDYLPRDAVEVDGDKIVVRYGGHEAVGRLGLTTYRVDGRTVDYDTAPTLIGTRLYLPLELLTLFTGSR